MSSCNMEIWHFRIKPFTFRWLILNLLYTIEINPFGRAVMWVLHYFFVLQMILLVWFLKCWFLCPIFLCFKGPKHDRTYAYLCHLPIMLISSLSDLFSMSTLMSKLWLCINIHHPDMTMNVFWYIFNMLISDLSFSPAERTILLWVGRWVFLQSVASTLKCFSLQHICPKWSLIAHWRMHDIKCLQTWNNHVLSPLRDCLF